MKGKILFRFLLAGLVMMALVMSGCEGDDGDDGAVGATGPAGADGSDAPVAPLVPTFSVKDTAGIAVKGATVYAIPAADVAEIAAVPIVLTAGYYDDASKAADEPLEDLLNGNFTPTSGGVANYVSGITDANGEAVLTDLLVGETDMYFIFVAPTAADTGHLPGGSLTRDAVSGASLDMALTSVEVSTTPSVRATYVGSSSCLACHTSYETQTQTAHRHGMMTTGSPGNLQDLTKFDDGTSDGIDDFFYDYMAGVDNFTAAGTTVWFYNYDSTRGFDKFMTSITDPTIADPAAVIWATARAYQDAVDSKYYVELTNVINPADTGSPMVREAMMTYGGGVYKQRYLTSFGDSESLYMLPLQYQATGDDANADRTRKEYRDYHLDFWLTSFDTTDSAAITFKPLPEAKRNFDINCASCHFTGFNVVKNEVTGESSASGVADVNGVIHPLTGLRQELNVGCETCHGPGSEHISAGGNGAAIVTPGNLSSSRETVICGQCHARAKGNDSFGAKTDATLDQSNQMMKPGTSRADYLANNTTRDDATTSNMWADTIHSKSHHQQYTDFIKSSKYRNDIMLLTCTSCHSVHAPGKSVGVPDVGTDRHQLSGATDDSQCLSCHTMIVSADHQVEVTGSTLHSLAPALCIECHNVKTAKSGAGEADPLDGGDISSHVFDVPFEATDAMPLAYNNSCGVCHGFISAP